MPEEEFWTALVSVLAVALGIAAWQASAGLPSTPEGYPGPALFPRVLAVVLLVVGLAVLAQALRRGWQPPRESLLRSAPTLFVAAALGAAPWLLSKLGLAASAGLYAAVVALLLGAPRLHGLLVGLTMGALVHLFFVTFLKVW